MQGWASIVKSQPHCQNWLPARDDLPGMLLLGVLNSCDSQLQKKTVRNNEFDQISKLSEIALFHLISPSDFGNCGTYSIINVFENNETSALMQQAKQNI